MWKMDPRCRNLLNYKLHFSDSVFIYPFIYFNPTDNDLSRSKYVVVSYNHNKLIPTLLSVLF
jgi:hypothetical protein